MHVRLLIPRRGDKLSCNGDSKTALSLLQEIFLFFYFFQDEALFPL